MSIKNKAMLVSLSVSMWTNAVKDGDVVSGLMKKTGTAEDVHRYKKVLIKPEALLQVRSARIAIRAHWWNNTLPWGNSGVRLLPSSKFKEFAEKMRELEVDFEKAVADFVRNYPKIKAEARQRLRDMFKEDDFPSLSSIKDRFAVELSVYPIPDAQDFRVSLSEGEMKELRKEVEATVQANTSKAMGALITMVRETVEVLRDRLKESDPTIRQSLVDNIEKVCAEVADFNVVDDKKVESVRKAAESLTKGVDLDAIKTDKKARKALADKADEILAKMASYTGGAS